MMKHLKTFENFDFDFDFDDDNAYLYIENGGDKCVLKMTRNYEWDIELEDGVYPHGLETTFRSQYDIEQIIELLQKQYDEVEQISEDEIDDYME